MSVARHHADWLSLVEVSGPFVSLPVLMRVFPQGLEPRDPAQAKALRAAYDEWQDNPDAPGRHRAWIMHVLTNLLGYPANQLAEGQTLQAGLETTIAEMGETLRPDLAVVGPSGTDTAEQPHLLTVIYPANQALDRPVTGKHWKATPATRMMELLHGAGVPLGLVTNGEHWMLVYAPRNETTGYASWYARFWMDEPITLRAFHSLLGARRLFGVAADSTLVGMLAESAKDQQEVTDQLGRQVREAVEVLIQALDDLDRDSNRTLLKGIAEASLYDAALTVMMRLVFMFSAEERGLLHLGTPLYDENYAVSTLQEQLQEVADLHGEEVLERRVDAWARLVATFRSLHGGIQHQDLMMQAYGGSLFDPDRYPFLEGRALGSAWRVTAAKPLAVNNRVVLHLLNSLQNLRVRVPGGGPAETRRISFRALGVEQIGHVYEGLLDHTAVRAREPVLGLTGTKDKDPEIALSKLESLVASGPDKLAEFLREETGRSVPALQRALAAGSLLDEHKLLIACGHDRQLAARARPFAGLIRMNSFERPVVALDGSLYVTEGTERRSTGTHYTPPSLTEPIAQHTLEPLVYEGPAEGLERRQWTLKSPKSILDLKVCDMAMGSGAFLVQTCRYLAERLVEAWETVEKQHPGEVLITPEGTFSTGSPSERLVPADANERIAIARRVVADRSLYGVDINPMAVEMAKLSLWLVTMDGARPFTFLDHAFKCGDSLLGITLLEQLENFSLQRDGGKQQAFATLNLWRHIEAAKDKREALGLMSSDTPQQITLKATLNAEAEEAVSKLNAAADVLISVELEGLKGHSYESEREIAADEMMAYWAKSAAALQAHARDRLEGRRSFHWPLAFPEVFNRGGFDAFVGNPPFMGGAKLETTFGTGYRALIVAFIANGVTGTRGTADLATYFLLRAQDLTRPTGLAGLIVTNSLGQGDAREVGLSQVLSRGHSIVRSVPSSSWPGQATVFYAMV
jgi:Eco57I restriction-modification methylase